MSIPALTLKLGSGEYGRSLQVTNSSGKSFSLQGWQLLFIDRQGIRRLYSFPSTIEGKRWWLDPGEVVELASGSGAERYSAHQGRFQLFLPRDISVGKTAMVSVLDDKGGLAVELAMVPTRESVNVKQLSCPSCGTSAQTHWVFCQHCGERLVIGGEAAQKKKAFEFPKFIKPGSRWLYPAITLLALVMGGMIYFLYQPNASAIVTRSEKAVGEMKRWKKVLNIGGEERWREEVIEPNRYRATIFHPDGAIREIVWIGKQNYSRRIDALGNTSKWILDKGNTFDVKTLRKELLERYIKPLRSLEGEQKIKSNKNFILVGKNTMGGKLTVLVDSNNNLPIKIEEEIPDPSGKGSTRLYVTTVEPLDDSVKIEPPK